jgi:hypothetical protein
MIDGASGRTPMARKTKVIAEADPAYAGQAAYTPALLRVYDI